MNVKLRLLAEWRLLSLAATARILHLLNFQGRAAVNATNFDCACQFKFAFRNSIGSNGLLNRLSLPALPKC